MKHLGDITKINGAEIPIVDCICGGSPCQDLSVAGKRAGLDGERSGLFMDQIRVVKEMREHDRKANKRTGQFVRPRYMVWENVPGALSSNKGEDFRCVLEETARIAERDAVIPGPPKGKWSKSGAIMGDGWSIAWRVHDAQFWGVPQRRKRIALVADFGGESAPEILFERKSLSGDIAKSGKEGQGIAKNASGSVGKTDATFYDAYQHHGWRESDTSGTLTAGQNNSVRGDTPLIAEDMKAIGFNRERCGAVIMDNAMPTLQVAAGESGNNQPMVALSFQERAGKPGGGKGILIQNERTGALSTLNNQSVCCLNDQGGSQMGVTEDVTGTLRADMGDNQPAIAFTTKITPKIDENGTAFSLRSRDYKDPQSVVYGISAYNSNAMKSSNPHSGVYEAETARTLDNNGGSPACNQGGMAVVESAGLEKTYAIQRNDEYKESDLAHTQAARDYKSATDLVVSAVDCRNMNESDVSRTLQSKDNGGHSLNYTNPIRMNSIVRRLTPLECERLQGFPDGWTDIGEWTDTKGKLHKGSSDSARYKALGNSIAIPFWFYLLRRISAQYERSATLGSLFDGIGGFPLCWERCNGPGTAIWASEIEEFPIAVTKKHFPEKE